MKSDVGLIGLGVMGQNLVLNMANHGYSVSVFNRTLSVVDEFIACKAKGYESIRGTHSIEEFVESLEPPKRIMLMVAGRAVDAVIEQRFRKLSGDIIMDCGNSFFKDTIRRSKELRIEVPVLRCRRLRPEKALEGPSIMPGGSPGCMGACGEGFSLTLQLRLIQANRVPDISALMEQAISSRWCITALNTLTCSLSLKPMPS